MVEAGDQFSPSLMARSEVFLTPLFRKAQTKSGADIGAARGRMLAYSKRSAEVRLQLVRRFIGKAVFTSGATAKTFAPKADVRPFTAEQLAAIEARVVEAIAHAIEVAGVEDQAGIRAALWQAVQVDADLADAVAGLLILAQL